MVFSGFVMSFRGHWFLATAGHIIEDLNKIIETGHRISKCQLLDIWNVDATDNNAIPFEYDPHRTFSWNEDNGIDFGLIYLSENTSELLRVNGVVPVEEIDWKSIPEDLDGFMMLGLPSAFERLDEKASKSHSYHNIVVSPTLICLKEAKDPPAFVKKKAPLWYFQVPEKSEPAGYKGSIDGMSGGPIIGIQRQKNGQTKYWIVGIQSGWYPESRIAYVVPTALAGLWFEECLKKFEEPVTAQ